MSAMKYYFTWAVIVLWLGEDSVAVIDDDQVKTPRHDDHQNTMSVHDAGRDKIYVHDGSQDRRSFFLPSSLISPHEIPAPSPGRIDVAMILLNMNTNKTEQV